jgi:hypothetical protein
MNYVPSILVALVLCAASAGLITWHISAWNRLQDTKIDPSERVFRRRQYRRRMQTSAMLGVLGVAIFIGQLLISWVASQLVLVVYWGGVLALLLWMALLAFADMVATSFYYGRQKTNYQIEQARLQGELQRAREARAGAKNGKPGSKP